MCACPRFPTGVRPFEPRLLRRDPEEPTEEEHPEPAVVEVEPQVENDVAHLPQVLLDLQAFMSITEIDRFSEMAVRTFSRAMKAELCLLLTPPEESGQLSIATGYDLISEQHLDGRSIHAEAIPVIAQAMERKQSVDLPAQSQAPDLFGLQQSLFLDRTGAVLFSPILAGVELIGGLVLFVIRPLMNCWRLEGMASFVETRVPKLNGNLSSALYFGQHFDNLVQSRQFSQPLMMQTASVAEGVLSRSSWTLIVPFPSSCLRGQRPGSPKE